MDTNRPAVEAPPNGLISLVDLKPRYQDEREELLTIVDRVLAKGLLVATPEVSEFEASICDYTGAKHCVSVNSGTDALMLSLWAFGIGRGDEVITTPISFVASTAAIVHVGATPVYVDVCDDQTMNPDLIEQAITPRTKAILPVHWGGRIAQMEKICAVAKKHNLRVIEDAAQSMGSWRSGTHGGRFGDIGAFSAHPLKNLNAIGDGGFLVTDNAEIAHKIKLYRTHGLASRDDCVMFGVNSRLDVLHAEVMRYRLEKLADVVATRRRNADLYRQRIKAPNFVMPDEQDDEIVSHVMFLVRGDDRDRLKEHLEANGIQSLVYYGTPLHLHRAAERLGYERGNFPVAEDQCDRVLALPIHQYLTDEEVSYVARQVNRFYGCA